MSETLSPGYGVASAAALIDRLGISPAHARSVPFPTGFDPLDIVLRGGFRAQDLVVLGGAPGVGKTTLALQWARCMAMQGHTAIYASYSHAPVVLLRQLLAIELAALARHDETETLARLQLLGEEVVLGAVPPAVLTADPLGEEAFHRLRAYGARLHLVQASGRSTGVADLGRLVTEHRDEATVLFVDHLQRVSSTAARAEPPDIQPVADGLKDLAMSAGVAVIAVAGVEHEALTVPRVRLHHLSASSALAHAADVVIVMNTLDAARVPTVVLAVEKHRTGAAPISLEFRKDLANSRFDPYGEFASDRWDPPF